MKPSECWTKDSTWKEPSETRSSLKPAVIGETSLIVPSLAPSAALPGLTSWETNVQEVAAVLQARVLLQKLADHRLTPRVPREIRAEARALLRWFPRPERLRPVLEGSAHLHRQGKPQGKPVFENQNPFQDKGSSE